METKRFEQLKREVESARSEAAQAKGAFEQLMKQLKEEFGCRSVEEAQKLLRKLEKEAEEAEESYLEVEAAYKKKWHGSGAGE